MRSFGTIVVIACIGISGSGCSGGPESYGHAAKDIYMGPEEGTAQEEASASVVRSDLDASIRSLKDNPRQGLNVQKEGVTKAQPSK